MHVIAFSVDSMVFHVLYMDMKTCIFKFSSQTLNCFLIYQTIIIMYQVQQENFDP